MPKVGTVSAYDVTLDRDAGPTDVLYVLLRAIKDDIEAGDDVAAREEAFGRQLGTAATDTIHQHAVFRHLGRDESVRRIVWNWAPTLAYYIQSFPGDREETARRAVRMNVAVAGQVETEPSRYGLLLGLADPYGEPNAAVVAEFEFFRETGYWRVTQLGFSKEQRRLSSTPVSATEKTDTSESDAAD